MPNLLTQRVLKKRRSARGSRREVTIKQVIVIDRLSMESKLAQVNAGEVHATGSGSSGLGMMQPKGRPQQKVS